MNSSLPDAKERDFGASLFGKKPTSCAEVSVAAPGSSVEELTLDALWGADAIYAPQPGVTSHPDSDVPPAVPAVEPVVASTVHMDHQHPHEDAMWGYDEHPEPESIEQAMLRAAQETRILRNNQTDRLPRLNEAHSLDEEDDLDAESEKSNALRSSLMEALSSSFSKGSTAPLDTEVQVAAEVVNSRPRKRLAALVGTSAVVGMMGFAGWSVTSSSSPQPTLLPSITVSSSVIRPLASVPISPIEVTPGDEVVLDAGVTEDAGIVEDTGIVQDTGIVEDTGIVQDTGIVTDGTIATDVVVQDTGIVTDGTIATDVVVQDTGIVVDGTSLDGTIAPDVIVQDSAIATDGVDVSEPGSIAADTFTEDAVPSANPASAIVNFAGSQPADISSN
jgi:hypothetical protein